MEIIEKNNRVKCGCGCVMEYEQSDIHKREISTMRCQLLFVRDYCELKYIECPQCGNEIIISKNYKGHN